MFRGIKRAALYGALGAGLASFAGSALAVTANVINFDPDGPGPMTVKNVSTFDWKPGNILARDCLPISLAAAGNCTIHMQAKLGTLNDQFGNTVTHTGEYTVIMSVRATPSITGSQITFTATGGGPGDVFKIYHDTVPTTLANNLAGTGFDDGTLILTGTPTIGSFTFTDSVVTPLPPLDAFGTNNHPNVISLEGTGSASVDIDVDPTTDTIDAAYFQGDFFAQAAILTVDAVDTTQSGLNFKTVDPAKSFVGVGAPDYGDDTISGPGKLYENDFDCDGRAAPSMGGTLCDLQLQADASTAFQHQNPVPEPGTLGLLGLTLGLLGMARGLRRRG